MRWFILLITVLYLTVSAEWIDLGIPGGYDGKAPDITLLNDDASGCRFSVKIYGFYLDVDNTPQGSYSRISLPSATYRMEKGNPDLPKLDVSIIIPDAGGVSCNVENEDIVDISVLPVIPSKGSLKRSVDSETIPYTFNDIYYNGQWYPTTMGEPQEPFVICNYRGTNVCLNVFQHNPVEGKLKVGRTFEVVIAYESPSPNYRDSISSGFFSIYQNLFLNFSKNYYGTLHYWKDLLIITHPDFLSEANRLADWKMRKGFLTYVRVRDDWTSQIVRDTIYNHYHPSAYDLYVILIGDPSRIPYYRYERFPRIPWDEWPTDVRYIEFNGDNQPDAFISRISSNWEGGIEQIRKQIDKIFDYEKLPASLSSRPFEWLQRGLVISSRENADLGHKTNYASMLERNNIFPWVERLWNFEANPTNITSSLENGRGFVNFLGHGDVWQWRWTDPGYTVYGIENAYSLQNLDKWPFIIGIACRAGWYAATSLADAFQWWANDGCGAVGYYGFIGDGTIEEPRTADSVAIQWWAENRTGTDIFPNTMGPVLYAGGVQMIISYPELGPYNFYIWHIYGDVTMQLRGGEQDSVRVSHEKGVHPGRPIEVWVRYKPYGSSQQLEPCPNAVVCLWRWNEPEFFPYPIYQRTNANGYALFYAPPTYGPIYLTVTKNNMSSYEGIVTVTDQEPPEKGEQNSDVELLNDYISLDIIPSMSSNTFKIKIPFYASYLDIFNNIGKLIKTQKVNKKELLWNGLDESGKPLPQGIYFVKASGKEKAEVKKLILMR